MQLWLIAFSGSADDFSIAELRARTKVNEWLRYNKHPRSAVHHMTVQTMQKNDGQWMHVINFLIEAEVIDWDLLAKIREFYKDYPTLPEPVEQQPKLSPRVQKQMYQRTEAQERILIEQNNHRALHMGAIGDFTYEEWKMLCDIFDNVCLACKQPRTLSIDHVLPLSRGGDNRISNIQPLCKRCNSQKRDKDTDYRNPEKMREFLARIGQMPS